MKNYYRIASVLALTTLVSACVPEGESAFSCTDNVANVVNDKYSADATNDIEMRCNGEAYIADSKQNQVRFVNLIDKKTLKTYALSSAPTDLEFDESTGFLYAGLSDTTSLAIINTKTDKVFYVNTQETVHHISAGKKGEVFISTGEGYEKNLYKLSLSFEILGPWKMDGSVIRYNRSQDQIVAATLGLSPSTITRYGFNESNELVELQKLRTNGGNGQDLAISNDGLSVALAEGGGNGPGYTIYDFDASDLTNTRGAWKTGAYPRGVDYSKDNKSLLATNGSELMLFDRKTHVEKAKFTIPSCNYSTVSKARFSAGDKLAVVKQECGFNKDSTNIYYFDVSKY